MDDLTLNDLALPPLSGRGTLPHLHHPRRPHRRVPAPLPALAGSPDLHLPDLEKAALIREVHVYGQSLPVGADKEGAAQHIGLGTLLLRRSEEIAREKGFKQLAVIAAIGTRLYYASRGFRAGELYMIKDL